MPGQGRTRVVLSWTIALAAGACGPTQPAPVVPVAPVPASAAAPSPATMPIRVVVRDLGGAPVARAQIVARPPRPEEYRHWPGMEAPTPVAGWRSLPPSWDTVPRAEAVTGDDGVGALSGLSPGLWSIALDAPGRVRRAATCKTSADVAVADVVIVCETGAPLAGRVLTDTGLPVPGATVMAEYPGFAPGGRCENARPDFAITRSDAQGRYRFDALPETIVAVRCGPPGAWSSHVWSVRVPSVASLDLRMTARGPVEGVVRGEPDGQPVAGADVVFSVATWHTANATAYTTTDAQGRYSIPLYPGEGVNSISVSAKGWWHEPKVVGARQPPFRLYEDRPTVLDLSLRPDSPESAAVRGVVRGPDGPVVGARVWLSSRDDDRWMSETRTTDAAGRYWFIEVPRQRLAVAVERAPGLYQPGIHRVFDDDGPPPDPAAPFWIAADAPRPVELDVQLLRGGRVSGRVVDEAGAPAAGIEVHTRNGVGSTSRADGTFAIDGLDEPSESAVFASAQDAAGERSGKSAEVVMGAGADVDGVEIRLHREAPAKIVVKGQVRVADPAVPVRGARVECDGAWVPCSTEGAFEVDVTSSYRPREVDVRIVVPDWGERASTIPVRPVVGVVDAGDIEVPRAGRIRGRVEDGAGPVAGAMVSIERKREQTVILCGFDEDASPPIAAVTDADGAFDAPGFVAGTYTVHVAADGYIGADADVTVGSDGDVAVADAKLSRAAWLRGRVVREGGKPVADASVSAEAENPKEHYSRSDFAYGWTVDDGGFELRVRAKTDYRLTVSPGGREREPFLDAASGPHVAGGDPVEIVVNPGRRISGRVVSDTGRRVEGASVWIDGDRSDAVRTDADGKFELTALANETYDLSAAVGLAEEVVLEAVRAGRTDVEIVLGETNSIEGLLVDEHGAPVSKRKLVATRMAADPDRADAAVEAVTDDAGRFRLDGVGREPYRIEAVRTGLARPGGAFWPLIGGAPVTPGARDVVLRIPSVEATTISGSVVDDAGQPSRDFVAFVHSRPNVVSYHSGEFAGTTFQETGLRLDAPCEIEAGCAGLRWQLAVPAGTRDLVLTVGADGLHGVRFGGRALTELPVRFEIRDAADQYAVPSAVRVVRVGSGAVVEEIPDCSECDFEVGALPLGAYRVEARRTAVSDWVACTPGLHRGEEVLILPE